MVITTRSDYELGASGNLLATYDDGALQASRYETGYGYVTASGARFYYHRDHLGNIRTVSNASGNTVRWTDYFAYGAIRDEWSVQTGRDNYGFIGKERDDETNSSDFGARTLLHGVDMWSSVDPLIVKYPDYSPYVYAGNNPLRFVDLNGMDWYQYTNKDGDVSTIWREGNAETISFNNVTYKNIGTRYNFWVGNTEYLFIQNEIATEETHLLNFLSFEAQDCPTCCYSTAIRMSNKTGKDYGAVGVLAYKQGIQMAKEKGEGEIEQTADWNKGVAYINSLINEGIAPVVGVDHTPLAEKTNGVVNDGTTDHYVVIASRKIDLRSGDVSYRYFDPGTGRGDESRFTFTRNNNGLLTGSGYKENMIYRLSHVVISKHLKP